MSSLRHISSPAALALHQTPWANIARSAPANKTSQHLGKMLFSGVATSIYAANGSFQKSSGNTATAVAASSVATTAQTVY